MTEYADAIASIETALETQWAAEAGTVVGGSPPVLLIEGTNRKDRPDPTPDPNEAWGRLTIRHTGNTRRTVGRSNKYSRSGTLTVQCFFPNSADSTPKATAIALARVAQKAFEGKRANAVTFREMRVLERGPDGSWYRADLVSEFAWDNR